jgi:acetyl esterase/lipase
MVDFRNCLYPSSAPEVVPYPGGLNDCVSGLHWLVSQADRLDIDRDRIVIAGDSGGGNLTLATAMKLCRDGDIGLAKGAYALCPFLAGGWPSPKYPSSFEFDGLIDFGSNRWAMAYGIEALEARDPLAWPGFAVEADVKDFPPTVISVDEFDPLRDEGIAFYRLLLRAGVPARASQIMGATHGTEVFVLPCPDISKAVARDIAGFARGLSG